MVMFVELWKPYWKEKVSFVLAQKQILKLKIIQELGFCRQPIV